MSTKNEKKSDQVALKWVQFTVPTFPSLAVPVGETIILAGESTKLFLGKVGEVDCVIIENGAAFPGRVPLTNVAAFCEAEPK